MRKRYARPKHRSIAPWPEDKPTPEEVALRVEYRGSAEHKSYPGFAGHPRLRKADASRCDPRYVDPAPITDVLREAIRRRCTSAVFEGDFPKYVWGWLDEVLYEARHINGPRGTYKAYPLELPLEQPSDPQSTLDWSTSCEDSA